MGGWRITGVVVLIAGAQAGDGSARTQEARLSEAEVREHAAEGVAEPQKLLDLPNQVSAADVRRILKALIKLRREEEGPVPDLLPAAFAKTLARVSHTAADTREVIGAGATKTVVRQVFYRRYREQWIFEHPLPCCVVFDCEKGKDLRVLAVLPIAEDRR